MIMIIMIIIQAYFRKNKNKSTDNYLSYPDRDGAPSLKVNTFILGKWNRIRSMDDDHCSSVRRQKPHIFLFVNHETEM